MIADAITAPPTLRVRKVKRTMSAKATLYRRSFVLGSLIGWADGVIVKKCGGLETIEDSGYALEMVG